MSYFFAGKNKTQESEVISKCSLHVYFNNLCCAKSLQSCLTLCNPMDYGPPDFSLHEILQARILEWVAMTPSRGSSPPSDPT